MHFLTDLYQFNRALAFRPDLTSGLGWSPATDVYETEEAFVVTLELAGVEREALQIHFLHDTLTLSGERSDPAKPASARYAQLEINYGAFRKEICFALPIERRAISAQYREGLLKVVLPKAR